MSTLEVVLIVVGIVLMIASFFITEKLTNQELDKIAELSTEEMKKILERNLNDAQVKVNHMVDQVIDQSIEKSIEYSDTVLESIHKTHNEVMFLYSMLNDKHSELTKYAGNLAQLAIHLEELQENIQKTVSESDEILQKVQESQQALPAPSTTDVGEESHVQEQQEEVFEEQEEELVNHNELILEKYREGKTAIEIARELGLGVGEVKLVIGLFREEEL